MELTPEDRYHIQELIGRLQSNQVRVATDLDTAKPFYKQGTLYIPPYDSYRTMFSNIPKVERFDLSKVIILDSFHWDCEAMFAHCKDLKSVVFPTVAVDCMNAPQLFKGCPNLETLDLSNIAAHAFDAGGMIDEGTKLTEVRMPAMIKSERCIPNKNIRIIMDGDEAYEQTLDSMVYGLPKGKGPTFVVSQWVFDHLKPAQYEHMSDSFTIEVIEN